jgi:hypothetical protein
MCSLLVIGQICAIPFVMTMTKVLSGISIQYPRRTSLLEASLTIGLLGSTVKSGSKKRLTAEFAYQMDRFVAS